MKQLNQLKNQHVDILNIIKESRQLLENLNDQNKAQLAKNISQLAGILKVHLGNEDRFLYPSFMKSEDQTLRAKATAYQNEMGNLSGDFITFKDQYNTKSKIDLKEVHAKKEIEVIFNAVEKRIHKEDHDLYQLASQL